jgi:hypothetical protein
MPVINPVESFHALISRCPRTGIPNAGDVSSWLGADLGRSEDHGAFRRYVATLDLPPFRAADLRVGGSTLLVLDVDPNLGLVEDRMELGRLGPYDSLDISPPMPPEGRKSYRWVLGRRCVLRVSFGKDTGTLHSVSFDWT